MGGDGGEREGMEVKGRKTEYCMYFEFKEYIKVIHFEVVIGIGRRGL